MELRMAWPFYVVWVVTLLIAVVALISILTASNQGLDSPGGRRTLFPSPAVTLTEAERPVALPP